MSGPRGSDPSAYNDISKNLAARKATGGKLVTNECPGDADNLARRQEYVQQQAGRDAQDYVDMMLSAAPSSPENYTPRPPARQNDSGCWKLIGVGALVMSIGGGALVNYLLGNPFFNHDPELWNRNRDTTLPPFQMPTTEASCPVTEMRIRRERG